VFWYLVQITKDTGKVKIKSLINLFLGN